MAEYVGGYDDWLDQRPQSAEQPQPKKNDRKKARPKPEPERPKKLGYLQQRELKELPRKIEALESEQKELFAMMSDPSFYKKDRDEIARVKSNLDRVDHEIETAYSHWEELEEIQSRGGIRGRP